MKIQTFTKNVFLMIILMFSVSFCSVSEDNKNMDNGSDVLGKEDTTVDNDIIQASEIQDSFGKDGAIIMDVSDNQDQMQDQQQDQSPESLAISGVYSDDWSIEHNISDSQWVIGVMADPSIFEIDSFSNSDKYVIAHNATTNQYNPDKWSRFDWLIKESTIWYCQTAYDAETKDDAMQTVAADPSNPEKSGCNTYPWSKLNPGQANLAIIGEYTDNYNSSHTITDTEWKIGMQDSVSIFEINEYSNFKHFLVAHNSKTNQYNPDKWSRMDWTWYKGELWFCQTSFDSETKDDAINVTPADFTDPENTGCGGYSWSKLIKSE